MHIISMLLGAFGGLILLFGLLSLWFFVCVVCFDNSDKVFLIGIGVLIGLLTAALGAAYIL